MTNLPGVGNTGNSMASFLLGYATLIEQDFTLAWIGARGIESGVYVADDIRVSRKLTLNLGLRWDYYSPYSEVANRWANFDAKTATVLVLEILQILLVVVVGVAIGCHVPAGMVPAFGLLLEGTVAFAGIGMLMAGTLRAEANLAAANGLFLVLLFLGGMAYPLAKLPTPVQTFAKALPAAALSETVRAVLSSQAFPSGELAVLVAWAIGAPLLAARYFRWEE